MGKVTIQDFTTKAPLEMIGYEAGICWGADVTDKEKNIKRAMDCIKSDHGRTLEFPDIYFTIDGYSAKVMRELYTHIGGAPSRLQASTRYIDYAKDYMVVIPPEIAANDEAKEIWLKHKAYTLVAMQSLKELGIKKEDYTNLLPLAYESKMVEKMGLRELSNICSVRTCSRAYWEMRNLVKNMIDTLHDYSDQWAKIIDETDLMKTKCDKVGYCKETYSCGKYSKLMGLEPKNEVKKEE